VLLCCVCTDGLVLILDDQLDSAWIGANGKLKFAFPIGSEVVSRVIGVGVSTIWPIAGEDGRHAGQMQAGLDMCMQVSRLPAAAEQVLQCAYVLSATHYSTGAMQ
jgi:hypothetical protein